MKKARLATLLRQIRLDANLTQLQLAQKIGQTQSYVSKYENGEQRLDLIELEAVCKAIGISLIDFVERYLESWPSLSCSTQSILGKRPNHQPRSRLHRARANAIKIPSLKAIRHAFDKLGLTTAHIAGADDALTDFGRRLFDYFAFRASAEWHCTRTFHEEGVCRNWIQSAQGAIETVLPITNEQAKSRQEEPFLLNRHGQHAGRGKYRRCSLRLRPAQPDHDDPWRNAAAHQQQFSI